MRRSAPSPLHATVGRGRERFEAFKVFKFVHPNQEYSEYSRWVDSTDGGFHAKAGSIDAHTGPGVFVRGDDLVWHHPRIHGLGGVECGGGRCGAPRPLRPRRPYPSRRHRSVVRAGAVSCRPGGGVFPPPGRQLLRISSLHSTPIIKKHHRNADLESVRSSK